MRSLYNNNNYYCILSVFNLVHRVFCLPTQRLQYLKEPVFNFLLLAPYDLCTEELLFLLSFLWNLWLQPKLTSFSKIYYYFPTAFIVKINNHSVAWFVLGVAFFCFIYVLDTQVVIHNMNVFIGSIDVWKTVPLETQGLYMTWSPILNI